MQAQHARWNASVRGRSKCQADSAISVAQVILGFDDVRDAIQQIRSDMRAGFYPLTRRATCVGQPINLVLAKPPGMASLSDRDDLLVWADWWADHGNAEREALCRRCYKSSTKSDG